MNQYIESVENDFGRIIALWEMCEYVGSNNAQLEKYSSEHFTLGCAVSYSSMIAELIITIGRLLDKSKNKTKKYNSYSLKSLLERFKEIHESEPEKCEAVTLKLKKLDSIYEMSGFKELISKLRNKCIAHSDIGFEMTAGDVNLIYDFCRELECFAISLGFDLGISIDLSRDYHSIWSKEAKKFWGSLCEG